MDRDYWARHIAGLDAQAEYEQIYRILVSHEFPWDMNQSLSFALYRTYAVPSIGRLLKQTGEFTERTQKRYDDTALILDTVLEHGMGSEPGRAAIRRMNQMHGCLPDLQRRQALRAVHVRDDADPGASPGRRRAPAPRPHRPPHAAARRTPVRPPAPQHPQLPPRLQGHRARHLPHLSEPRLRQPHVRQPRFG